jgi:integrase
MACLYHREDSKYWWIEYIDASGERRQGSTKLRRAFPGESRKAIQLRDELTRREIAEQTKNGAHTIEVWQAWAPRLIKQRYAESPKTRERAEQAWHNILTFFRCHGIIVPRQLTRQQVRDFFAWRQIPHPDMQVRRGAKNTAILEIKFLGTIMEEAIESGFATHNPCLKLGLKRNRPKKKPAIKIDEHRLIIRSLREARRRDRRHDWMLTAYRIAYWQGCRISETHLPLGDIDLARNVFGTRTKGEKSSIAEFPLSPRLRPLFRRLLADGQAMTYDPPKSAPKVFWAFLRKIGLNHLTFHCTRNSFITRCYERGIHREDVMRLAGHSSYAAHEIYPRLTAHSRHLQEMMARAA